ncbi:MAG: hypothetical protein CMJ27_13980 [Phycisphaerae bacterium]|nr:hypothetical protein [Phycisphaerae bacterium]OUW99814.1 MAG: hypothetical protein CBD91_08115 [Phycisphaeraceae bacterium TMED231]
MSRPSGVAVGTVATDPEACSVRSPGIVPAPRSSGFNGRIRPCPASVPNGMPPMTKTVEAGMSGRIPCWVAT